VTGAAGLIGGAVTRLLLARGHHVIACDDFSVGTWRDADARLTWEDIDVASANAVERLSRHDADVVVHCAAHPGGRSNAEPTADVRVNAFGSMQVFEWCARHRIPVVYLSSSAVYGEQPAEPILESAVPSPGTIYAVCKVACENFLRVLGAEYGLEWTVLRLFATYGPGHRPSTAQGMVNVMLTQLLAGNRVVVRGSLERVRDLLYVDDAAEAIVTCLGEPCVRGRVLNVGSGVGTTVREVLGGLCAALGRNESVLEIEEQPGTPGDPLYSVANTRAFAEATSLAARVRVDEGLARLVATRVGH
jgi:UDP-glucose 4-epimerase